MRPPCARERKKGQLAGPEKVRQMPPNPATAPLGVRLFMAAADAFLN
jgi:hypothetical protein